jgi:hypothetical protein
MIKVKIDRNFAKAWNNKGFALIELRKYYEGMEH